MAKTGEKVQELLDFIYRSVDGISLKEKKELLIEAKILKSNKFKLIESKLLFNQHSVSSEDIDSLWEELQGIVKDIWKLLTWFSNHSVNAKIVCYRPHVIYCHDSDSEIEKIEANDIHFLKKVEVCAWKNMQSFSDKPEKILVRSEATILLELLEGVPPKRLKQCDEPGCKNFFVQTTKREKKYCSPRCQNKISMNKFQLSSKRVR